MAQAGAAQYGKRRTHRKVRTGCITCKIRRVKCDEEKPSCHRCRSTGRKCDGYADLQTSQQFVSVSSSSPSDGENGTGVKLEIKPSPQRSDSNSRALEYFHAKTLPAVSGFIDTDLWSRLVLQLGETEPAIKSGISAFSAYHELVETHGFDQVGGPEAADDTLALQHYTKAVGQLRSRLSQRLTSKTVTLMCCMIFTCLEFIKGDRKTALTHLKSGMNILRLQAKDEGKGIGDESVDDCLAPAFSRMSLIQTIYGQPRDNRYIDLLTVPEPQIPFEFTSLEAARISQINTTNSVMSLAYMMDFKLFPSVVEAKAAQIVVVESIEQWMVAFAPMLDRKDVNQRAALLLKSSMIIGRIWISRYLRGKGECAFDEFMDDFHELIAGMETVIGDGVDPKANGLPSFTIDTGMISTLYFTANKCRARKLRRRAVELIKKCPRKEGLFDSAELSKVAEFIIETEEEGSPPLPNEEMPAEEKRVSDYRIVQVPKGAPSKVETFLHHGLVGEPGTMIASRTLEYGDGADQKSGADT